MSLEIERKFLVRGAGWRAQAAGNDSLRQGYLANTRACSVRVRIAGERGWLSVKGMTPGRVRPEFEYEIPEADAAGMLAALTEGPEIEKVRHRVVIGARVFEVDEFHGANRGLVIAEIELESVDAEFERPDWLGDEVTDDARYYNFRLAAEPFAEWPDALRRAAIAGRNAPGASL
ncbi:MAG: CYTH domain-containing protein [Steroidobacteraceae bacterium]